MTDADSQPDSDWTPDFPGQRPPFQPGNDIGTEHRFTPGNEAALVHGARSDRHIGPLAEQIAAELLASPGTPEYVRQPVFAHAVAAWAWAEATVRTLRSWLADRDIMAGLADAGTATEEEKSGRGWKTRKTSARHLPAVNAQLDRAEARAERLRARLGLDPASAARVGRDLAASRYLTAATPLDQALDAIAGRRAELGRADQAPGGPQ